MSELTKPTSSKWGPEWLEGNEQWRVVWRKGIAPLLPTEGLEALAVALVIDDPKLIHRHTTCPPPLSHVTNWPCEGACSVGYVGWKCGAGYETVGQVEEFFAKVCYECDQRMQEPAACRWFLNWFDDTPRDEMRKLLLAEVRAELARRAVQEAKRIEVLTADIRAGKYYVPGSETWLTQGG